MPRLLLPLLLIFPLLLSGCVTQRYAGIRIVTTGQVSITKVVLNNNEVVVCSIKQ
ncbi:hypothetical protein [Enterobacter ludwigii]|uniref:hypothetical protein n=1 Tax=Enterobacter ludwigii TaxID=299767 RepID=UPI000ADFAF4C|nr:hypothetical protein [Enterobacter ludwigii]